MKKIIVLFATVTLILSGCSVFTPKKETVCKIEEDGMDVVITSVSKGNKILTDEFKSSFSMDSEMAAFLTKETIEEELEKDAEEYDIEGITYSYKVTDEKVTLSLLVEYSKIDFDKAMELGLVDEESEEDANYVDFDTTIDGRKDDGMTCKTK